MWGFWWLFPVIGLLICLGFMVAMMRVMAGGGHFMCMRRDDRDGEETARLRREVEDLREQIKKQAARGNP
jgi:hypothetical protein